MRRYFYVYIAIIALALAGCVSQEYNTATGKQDIMLISTDKEIEMGRRIAESLEKNPEVKLDPDPLMAKRVSDIGARIASVTDRKEVNYTFRVIDDDDVNAFALPGGYVFIFRGLVEKVDSDDELAGVIAHEMAHVVARHSIKRLQGGLGYTILQILMVVSGTREVRNINAAFGQLTMAYSREDEALADMMAIKYLRKAGYEPFAMLSFLEKLQQVHREQAIRPYSSYRSHPHIADRIRMVRQELTGQTEFSDYMNKPLEY
ncbi:MAG: M48 family metalloprotease [Candidatus Omnitrophica bacterium]|nr:M48 family metalloprotease [Candidatus Omnitrophota bacterium]MBU1933189.1 M48 family metalloprotease [Candidatus Omnitrophota bacterium]